MGSQQSLYARLDPSSCQIRLVHIQPGVWDDPILCELETVSLNSSPVYQTLSYFWGDPKDSKPILLEDCVFDVTSNLYDALRRLRRANSIRVIWIDAICINQMDNDEKSQQVMLMKSIYSKCKEVIMWLGDGIPGRPNDSLTIDEGSYKLIDYFAIQPPIFHLITGGGMNGGETPAVVRRFRKGWRILGQIVDLPYWRRVWIVQENILPPLATVVLGSISIPWKAFSSAIDSFKWHVQWAGTWEDAHWRTICGDLFSREQFYQGTDDFRRTVPEDKATFENWQRANVDCDMQYATVDQLVMSVVQIPVIGAVVGRRVFTTEQGYLGLGPRDMEVGDQVFILSGSNVPFVLRESETAQVNPLLPAYSLVGDCYVHGIMYGQSHNSEWLKNAKSLVLR
ncbi:hypothetical protein OIDMADRAFT_136327 [Oidiodendron maius Zn]|uniref:Heterokaryon incompatibility domain-containing protein n=1 Tax=Oidiodendron maius (strain Zn) TaxID=913774 RepID=A0A0C3CXI0_OIDMZ|nr:hypothetical protein OIDMADRAFT_136327 [Oidiodendron maius Zn]